MALPPTADAFEKARRTSKMHLIAHAMFMANKADVLSKSIRAAVGELKDKKITEAEAVAAIQEMVVDELHEMQVHVLSQRLAEIACASGAIQGLKARAARQARDR